MSVLATVRQRWGSLPRSGKWISALVVVLVAYFGLVEPVMLATDRLRTQADALEAELRDRASAKAALESTSAELERALIAFGPVKAPVRGGDPLAALDRRLSTIRSAHSVQERQRRLATRGEPISRDGVRFVGSGLANGQPLERFTIEWQFEGTTDALMRVLADLEKAPEVHAVSSVQLRRLPNPRAMGGGDATTGQISVTLVSETWAVAGARGASVPTSTTPPEPAEGPPPASNAGPAPATDPASAPATTPAITPATTPASTPDSGRTPDAAPATVPAPVVPGGSPAQPTASPGVSR
ncbi:MAG: hypothetical protein ACK48N_11610 [Planctomyces sp.]